MKIALTSDTHLGLTSYSSLRKMFTRIRDEKPDVLVHAGDYCGGFVGSRSVRSTVKLMRELLPDTPIVSVIGNHDLWYRSHKRGATTLAGWIENYEKIVSTFKEYGVHFLDEDGPLVLPQFPEVMFVGHTGWYANPNPPTNDPRWMPIGVEGDTNAYLLRRANQAVGHTINYLSDIRWTDQSDRTLIFVSHFPVIKVGDDYAFETFSWYESIGRLLREDWNCAHFLCGHAHQRHEGPIRYEAGSDYYRPTYQSIEIPGREET